MKANAAPERYQDLSDPYYSSEEFKSGYRRAIKQVVAGMPIDYVGKCVFNAINEIVLCVLPILSLLLLRQIGSRKYGCWQESSVMSALLLLQSIASIIHQTNVLVVEY